MSPLPDECQFWLREGEQRGFHRGLEYVRQAVASEPTLSWPGEIDDILELNRGYAVVAALLDAEKASEGGTYIEVRTTACHAGIDGECSWVDCPQIRDGEPVKSSRHCPLAADEASE